MIDKKTLIEIQDGYSEGEIVNVYVNRSQLKLLEFLDHNGFIVITQKSDEDITDLSIY